jgi:SOS-response transcriptional repressor LexA
MPKRNAKQAETYSVRAIPYEGQVGAGRLLPFVAKDGVIEVPVPDSIGGGEQLGTMTVNGNSLERVGIFDGDIVLVRRVTSRRQIKRNSICVVYIPSLGEVLAKKITFEDGVIILHHCGLEPREPLAFTTEEVEIRGIVISATKQQPDWPFVDAVVPARRLVASSGARVKKVRQAIAAMKKPEEELPF